MVACINCLVLGVKYRRSDSRWSRRVLGWRTFIFKGSVPSARRNVSLKRHALFGLDTESRGMVVVSVVTHLGLYIQQKSWTGWVHYLTDSNDDCVGSLRNKRIALFANIFYLRDDYIILFKTHKYLPRFALLIKMQCKNDLQRMLYKYIWVVFE